MEYVKRKEMIPLLDENSDLHEALHEDTKEDEEWLDDEWEDDDSLYDSTPRHTKAQAKVSKNHPARKSMQLAPLRPLCDKLLRKA